MSMVVWLIIFLDREASGTAHSRYNRFQMSLTYRFASMDLHGPIDTRSIQFSLACGQRLNCNSYDMSMSNNTCEVGCTFIRRWPWSVCEHCHGTDNREGWHSYSPGRRFVPWGLHGQVSVRSGPRVQSIIQLLACLCRQSGQSQVDHRHGRDYQEKIKLMNNMIANNR